MSEFEDHFDGPGLDTNVWIPHYLPQWSSRAESAATYVVAGSELRLSIPPDQGLWCPEVHDPPLRVSGIQSGVFAGPAGGSIGQHAFREGLIVSEEQQAWWGWTPQYGRLEIRARMDLSPRSMAAMWMVGREEQPEESAELLVFEIFGDALETDGRGPAAAVGMGVRRFNDPAITGEFVASRVAIDVADRHVYAAEWRPGRVDILVDDERVKTVDEAPDYPMQMIVAVFDFPDHDAAASHPDHVPELAVDCIRGRPLG